MVLNENSINIEYNEIDSDADNNTENNETENDADDNIEKHLRNTLIPFQIINFLTFNSRHHITKNRITTKDKTSIFLTILGTTILICEKGYELYVLSYKNQLCWYRSVANFAMYFDIFFSTFGYIFNTATLIKSREKNASFIIKLNKIYKALGIKKEFKFHLFIVITIYFSIHLTGQNRSNVYNEKYFTEFTEKFVNYYSLSLMTSFDFNIIFAMYIMKLLKVIIETWTSKIKNCEKTDDMSANEFYDHYISFMDLYKTYNDLLQNMILFHNLDCIIHQLLYMGIFVELFAYNNIPIEAFLLIFTLLMIAKCLNSCLSEVLLVYECERFYAAHDNAMEECEVLLKNTDSDHVRKICKNIRRVASNEFNKITICKLYEMDAQYLQGVAMLIANYLLVIMQFENLKFTSWERFNATILSQNYTVIENNLS